MRLNKEKVLVQLAERCMNQVDLAKAYGCKQQYISVLLNKPASSTKTIGKLAKTIGCSVLDIIDLEEDK